MEYKDDKVTRVSQPPPYSQYPSGPVPQTSGVVTASPVVVPVMVSRQMGPDPTHIVCTSCRAEIITKVEMKPTTRTHLFALLLCVFGCWPCVCIPYCVDSCNNADHYCSNCNAYLGSYSN